SLSVFPRRNTAMSRIEVRIGRRRRTAFTLIVGGHCRYRRTDRPARAGGAEGARSEQPHESSPLRAENGIPCSLVCSSCRAVLFFHGVLGGGGGFQRRRPP